MAELQLQQQANGIGEAPHINTNSSSKQRRQLVLRLDDGSLIGPVDALLPGTASHGGAVLLDFEAACRTGRAGQNELQRLDRLIQDFQARVSGFHSIPRSELKQRNPYTQDVQRAIKRQRSLAAGDIPPFPGDQQLQQQLSAQQPHHAAAAALGGQHPLQQQASGSLTDFLPKCTEVLNRVYAACATMPPIFNWSVKEVFFKPVNETFPMIAGEYYSRISHPMTFREIEQRIKDASYVSPQMFADDMRLLFQNCKTFNPMHTDPVRLACLKLIEVFENAWVTSGLCAEVQRAKRATAGIAAPKFEPEEYDGAGTVPPRRTTSHRSGEQQAPLPGQQQQRRGPDGLPRVQSHEVSSYREEEVTQNERPIPEDVLQFVAEQLQELPHDNLQVALGKFNEGVVAFDAEGEVELDLEKVNYESLMVVDSYVREVLGMPARQPEPAGGGMGGAAAGGAAAAAPSTSMGDPTGAASGAPRSAVRAEQDEDDDYFDDDDSDDDD